MSLLLTAVAALHQSGQMVVFSTRSRHTYGIETPQGQDHFDLPLLEFQAVFRNDDDKEDDRVGLHAVDTSGNLFWAVPSFPAASRMASEESSRFRARVGNTAAQAVLTHASFDILLSIPPTQFRETASIAATAGCELSSSHTEVVDMRNPNLSILERGALLAEAGVVPLIQNGGSRTSTSMADINSPLKPSPFILLRRFDGHVHVGLRTGTGPAAGSGAPGIAPRRNYKGILGKLALKNRLDNSKHLTRTAMEPEIAIVMANLGMKKSAANNHNTKVLDPCCGSSSLLIAAAACGASTLVGVDLNSTAFWGADKEFQRHGLPLPFLATGNVLESHLTPALAANDTYHAILCDPPYGIGAPILDQEDGVSTSTMRQRQQSNCEENNDQTKTSAYATDTTDRGGDNHSHAPPPSADTIVAAVLGIARRTLVIGGRIVMFVPVRGEEAALSISRVLLDRGCSVEEVAVAAGEDDHIDAVLSAGSLRLVHGRRQCFSPTFSRWLVVMERVK
jgi:16S rRNA G966 N2-methylase RsmD